MRRQLADVAVHALKGLREYDSHEWLDTNIHHDLLWGQFSA